MEQRIFKVWERFTHRDGSVSLEQLWYRVGGEGRFLGLVRDMTEAEAEAAAQA